MTDPSKERIAAALRLAQTTELLGRTIDGDGVVTDQLLADNRAALVAYRATLPRIRSRAEVEREFCEVLNAAPSAVYGGGEVKFLGVDAGRVANLRLELDRARLSEPTDSGPSSVDTPDPPPVPVSPAGADLLRKRLRDIHEICDCYASIDGERQLEIWNLSAPGYPSGPPGVAAAKESTDNAAALEGAALDFHKRVAEALGLSDGDQGSYIYADEERCLLEIRDNRRDAEQWNEHQLNTAADAESHGCDSGVERCSCEESEALKERIERILNTVAVVKGRSFRVRDLIPEERRT